MTEKVQNRSGVLLNSAARGFVARSQSLQQGQALANFLNGSSGVLSDEPIVEEQAKVLAVVELCERVQEPSRYVFRAGLEAKYPDPHDDSFRKLEEELRRCSFNYSTSPLLLPSGEVDMGIATRVAFGTTLPTGKAIEATVSLAKSGEIRKLRRCKRAECQAWFMAARTRQETCSQGCRRRLRDESPLVRERRAKNARDDYDEGVREVKISQIREKVAAFHSKPRRKGASVEEYVITNCLGITKTFLSRMKDEERKRCRLPVKA